MKKWLICRQINQKIHCKSAVDLFFVLPVNDSVIYDCSNPKKVVKRIYEHRPVELTIDKRVKLLIVEVNHHEGEYDKQHGCDDRSDKTKDRTFDLFISEHLKEEWSGDHDDVDTNADEVGDKAICVVISSKDGPHHHVID